MITKVQMPNSGLNQRTTKITLKVFVLLSCNSAPMNERISSELRSGSWIQTLYYPLLIQ